VTAADDSSAPTPPTSNSAPPGPSDHESAEGRSSLDRLGRPFHRVYKGIAAGGVVVGAVVGLLSLVDWFDQRLDDPPPVAINARIDDVRQRSARKPFVDYLKQTKQSLAGLTAEQLRQRGYVFDVELQIVGEVGQKFPLRWSVYQARSEERLRGEIYNQFAGNVRPKGPSHTATWPVWIPYPRDPGTYFVEFTLEDEDHRPVYQEKSRRFHFRGL
jgi:hypothetical protein